MQLRERAALLLLVGAGACFLPGALDRFVFPKLAVAAAGAGLALTVPARGRLPDNAKLMLGLSAGLLLLAALVSSAPLAELLGRAPRYEGLIALPVYAGALIAGARLLGPDPAAGAMAWLLDVLSVAALVIGVEAVLEAAGLRPLVSNVSRPGSLLGNASDQGAWAVLALGPLTITAFEIRQRLHVAGAIAAAAVLVTSGSRGALVGTVVVAAALIACRPRRELVIVLGCALAAAAAGVLAIPATRSRVLQTSPLSQQTATGRELLWSETLSLIDDHPLLGVGPSGYVDSIPVYHDRRYEREVGPQSPPDSPHDWILQAAAAGGPALALLAIALAALTLARGWRSIRGNSPAARDRRRSAGEGESVVRAGMLAGLAGYATALLFHFTTAGTAPLAALYAGALLSRATNPTPRARLTAPLVALYGFLVALLAAAAFAELPLRSALIEAAAGNLGAANNDFRLARDLRPWDAGVAQIAAHAYAVLARHDVPGAAPLGASWAAKELSAYPDSIQGLEDAASLQMALGHRVRAEELLRSAQRLEPRNPQLRDLDSLGAS
jgi:O-antigen ligase